MRWSGQAIGAESASALPGLGTMRGLVRSVQTPEFAGITFHEVLAKSALNQVPGSSNALPFAWTINPYRGCSHACVFCFARQTHTYLDFDAGRDFDAEIVVKVNVAEILAKELARPSWQHAPVALGTNTDPLPARRRPLPADARHHRGARRLGNTVQHPHQGHAAAARHSRSCRPPPSACRSSWR